MWTIWPRLARAGTANGATLSRRSSRSYRCQNTKMLGLSEDLRVVDVGPGTDYRERDAGPVATRWRFEPGLRRSVGFLLTASPPFCGHARLVHRCPLPVDLIGLPQPVEEHVVQFAPHTRLLPAAQAPPAGRTRSSTHLLEQYFQGIPLFKTKMMPVSAARSGTRGLPPLGLGGSGGKSGSISSYSSSLTSSLPIPASVVSVHSNKSCKRLQEEDASAGGRGAGNLESFEL